MRRHQPRHLCELGSLMSHLCFRNECFCFGTTNRSQKKSSVAPNRYGRRNRTKRTLRNARLLSMTYLIVLCWQKLCDWAVMNSPVIWNFLCQAKVSHDGGAHVTLPAHQAVLHRDITHQLTLYLISFSHSHHLIAVFWQLPYKISPPFSDAS